MSAEERLRASGIVLPPPTVPVGNYVPWRIGGSLLFLSGVGPQHADGGFVTGQVTRELTLAEAIRAARLCGLALLGNMRAALGSLDRVECVLKVFGMVNAPAGFTEQPEVINGCTDVFVDVLGEAGRPARSAVGMGSLPRNIPVEVEAVVLIGTGPQPAYPIERGGQG
jgi:enamine deaminase RidA (YjgF/YER057c/UK114 family)